MNDEDSLECEQVDKINRWSAGRKKQAWTLPTVRTINAHAAEGKYPNLAEGYTVTHGQCGLS